MSGKVVGVHRQIGLDAFETRDHAGERAYVLAKACNRCRRRNRSIPSTRHQQLAAATDLDGDRRTTRVAQLGFSAAWTLRARGNIVPHDSRAEQIEADHVISQIGAELRSNRFGNLQSRELDCALPNTSRRSGDGEMQSAR